MWRIRPARCGCWLYVETLAEAEETIGTDDSEGDVFELERVTLTEDDLPMPEWGGW